MMSRASANAKYSFNLRDGLSFTNGRDPSASNANLCYRARPNSAGTIDNEISCNTNIIHIYMRSVYVYARGMCVRTKNPLVGPPNPHVGVGAIFPPNCESMQIIPVESSIKRRFYLKGGEGAGEKSGRLMHRIGKRAGYIYKTLSSFAIHLSHRNCD